MSSSAVRAAFSGQGVGVPLPGGAQLPDQFAGRRASFFALNFDALNVLAGTTRPVVRRIEPSYDFVAYWVAARLRSADNLVDRTGDPYLLALYQDAGRQFQPVGEFNDIDNIAGTGRQPAPLVFPLIIMGGDTITASFVNLHNANAHNVRLTLLGAQVWR